MSAKSVLLQLYKREFLSYFSTPLAIVFIIIFLVLNGLFTFQLGNFYQRGQAELDVFFSFHPWLYLFLMPALAMGLWAEERKSGTIELLLTLPVTIWQVVLAKFLAAWSIAAIALALTFPIWMTVNYLGTPDNGIILAGYIGSFLLAGAYLAVGACISATTQNQVIAFIISVVVCFIFLIIGFQPLLELFSDTVVSVLLKLIVSILVASVVLLMTKKSVLFYFISVLVLFVGLMLFPGILGGENITQGFVDAIASLSFLTHFDAITKGVLDLRDAIYFILSIAFWLLTSVIVIDIKKAD
ncbi:ABC transporter permease [Pleionea sp. CnH1-48]|uniref:ABC transporter permease n=1 Tax=Pleionea sp. CnH1-48 TaxID=2954494 RepID=UPI0020980E6C|nr:ABC transporter permease [Pleionea sp. CnH1-48]MCO7226760.1 ABC transporter permease [Pleionea sp. CnH1-48]